MTEFKTMMVNNYRIPCNSNSTRHCETGAIIEKVHQTISNITHTLKIKNMDSKDKNP